MMRRAIKILTIQFLFIANAYGLVDIHATEAYGVTRQTWTKTYKQLVKDKLSVEGATYIAPLRGNGHKDRLHKNGARDTIVFIPYSTNVKQPIDIVFYFHGLGGFKERDFGKRVLRHTRCVDPARNYAVVIAEMPWSKNTLTPRKRQGRVFHRKGKFTTFVESIRVVLRRHFYPDCDEACPIPVPSHILGDITLLGHSAGGSTLMSISRSGGLNWLHESSGASSVKIIFSDASYGRWLDITWKYFKPRYWETDFLIVTRKWDKPYRHAKRFLNKFKRVPVNISHVVLPRTVTHGVIGDRSFSYVYAAPFSGCGEGEDK